MISFCTGGAAVFCGWDSTAGAENNQNISLARLFSTNKSIELGG